MALTLLMWSNVGWGQALLVENFEYPEGTLLVNAGWAAHSGAGQSSIAVVSPGLTFSGYYGSGIGNAAAMITSGEDVNRGFVSQNTGSIYVAFLVNISAATTGGDYFIHFTQTAGGSAAGFFTRVFARRDAENNLAFGISKGGAANYTGFDYSLNTTYLLVAKYTFVEGLTNDYADLFINPIIGSPEPSPTITGTDVAGTDATAIAGICLRQGGGTSAPSSQTDAIRVATTWADAVKASEPSVNVSVSSLSDFAYMVDEGPSTVQSFSVSGIYLTNDISVSLPTNYELSLANDPFVAATEALTLAHTDGTVASTTVYVRLKADLEEGEYDELINITSTDAESMVVSLSGAVTSAPIPTLELNGEYVGPYYAGDEVIVTWTATNLDFVVVEAWVPHENMWIAMTESVDAELGTASFNVPLDAPYSANYKIRVRNAEAETPVDESATFKVRAVTDNLATVRAYAANDEFRYEGVAVVTAMDGFNNRKFIQDESAAILIFDNGNIIATPYVIGDGMSGIIGRKTVSSNMVRLVPLEDPGEPVSTGNPVIPTVMTLDEVVTDDQSKLLTFEMVNFVTPGTFANGQNYNITDGTNTFVLRTDFWDVDYIGVAMPTSKFNLTGVLLQFNAVLQIVPRNLADFVVFSNDATLETFTLGGVDVLDLSGIVVADPEVEEGAELFVSDISEFTGIVAVASDENATVSITVDGVEVLEANWADYAFESNDVVLATVEAEDGTINYYKVTLVDTESASINVESINFYFNWPNEPVEITITWNDASEVTAFQFYDEEESEWIDLPAITPEGTFWEVIPIDEETATFKIYLEYAPEKSTKEGDFFTGYTEDVRIVFDLGMPAEFEVKMMIKTFDLTFIAVDENEVPIENFTVTVTPVDEDGYVVAQVDNVVEVAASFAYNYTIVAYGYATVEGTTEVIMEDETISVELESTDVPKVISYWNFNDNQPATDTNWDQPIPAAIGGGELTYTFTQAYSFAGTTMNGVEGEVSGGSFAARGGVDQINNGRHFIMTIPTIGFEGIVLSYAVRPTSSGFKSHEVQYTINGTDWLTHEIIDLTGLAVDWHLLSSDFTGVEGVDYNPEFAIRMVLTGATTESGNNRFDNIKVTGFGLNYETNILSFAHPLQMTPTVIDQEAGTVSLQVLNGTDLSALSPSFTLSSGATAWVGGNLQESGESVVNFTNPVTYTVLAENETDSRDWTVSITQAPVSNLAAITAFTVPNLLGNAVIDSDEKTVHAIVSYGTDLTELVPTITVSLGATISPESGVVQDFTAPVVYTVTAQDGTTSVEWTVTVVEVTLLPISEIRFTPHEENVSLYNNTIVATTGIVTAYYYYLGNPSGYYLQDGVAEWCGIMAYTGSGTLPAIGDEVRVSGMIGSFGRNTQFTNSPLTEVLSSGNDLPAPVVLPTGEVGHYKWQSMILRVENAECTSSANSEVTDGTGPIRLDRQLFSYTALAEGSFYNIVGMGASDNQHFRLRPRSANDIELISSVKPVWGESIATYPNPFSNTIWIDNLDNAKRIVVVNLLGQQVMNVELFGDSSTSIQTENLPSGVYLVTIVNAKGERSVRKMIKR